MYILLVAATRLEIQPTIDFLREHNYVYNGHEIDVLITGIGSISTTYLLSYNIHNDRPDYLIQAGVAGSFSEDYPPGSLVLVNTEVMADLGVEENQQFRDVFDMQLLDDSTGPYSGRLLLNPYCDQWMHQDLPFVQGITVNEITTSQARIDQYRKKYLAESESMEGAAFHYTALMEKIPFIQLRAISNYVGERDKSQWKLKEAIGRLNENLQMMIRNLPDEKDGGND